MNSRAIKSIAPTIRLLSLFLVAILIVTSVSGCNKQKKDGITVVCTVFPLYDWAREICRSTNVEVILLADNGVDLHSYQPTAADVIQIAECDLLLTIGGPSEAWVEDLLINHPSENRVVCRMSALDGIILRQISEESLACEDENCQESDHSHNHAEDTTDEHLWLSLKNALIGCREIANQLCKLDEANRDIYQSNLAGYSEAIRLLDQEYSDMIARTKEPTVLFADRFPFVYLMEDYGVRYAAAFRGCTTDTDASFETIFRLSSKVDEWGLSCVITTEIPTPGLAEQVVANTKSKNQKILVMNSLQAAAGNCSEEGISYIGIMKKNQEVLKEALTNS